MLDDLVNHYSGELPCYEPNLEKASEVASDEVTLESPQQQAPNLQMASTTLFLLNPTYLLKPLQMTNLHLLTKLFKLVLLQDLQMFLLHPPCF